MPFSLPMSLFRSGESPSSVASSTLSTASTASLGSFNSSRGRAMTMGEEDDAERSWHGALEKGEGGRESGKGGGRGEETKEEEVGGGAARGPKTLVEEEEGSNSRWCMCAAPAATTAAGRRTRKGLRIAGCVVVVLSLFFLAALSAYLGLVATIEPPLITLQPSTLQNLLIDGSYLNAVVSFGGIVENKSTFKVLIEDPAIHVDFQGAALGKALLPTIHLPPLGSVTEKANATFYHVNNIGGEGGRREGGTTALGKQLVDEVLGKKVSRLGLKAGVRANAYVFGDKVPISFPILLELVCEFNNDWGGKEGGRGEVCGTHLHAIWKKPFV